MVTIAVQSVILCLVASPFGLRPTWSGVIASIAVIAILAIGISAFSDAIVGTAIAVVLGALLACWGIRTFQRQRRLSRSRSQPAAGVGAHSGASIA